MIRSLDGVFSRGVFDRACKLVNTDRTASDLILPVFFAICFRVPAQQVLVDRVDQGSCIGWRGGFHAGHCRYDSRVHRFNCVNDTQDRVVHTIDCIKLRLSEIELCVVKRHLQLVVVLRNLQLVFQGFGCLLRAAELFAVDGIQLGDDVGSAPLVAVELFERRVQVSVVAADRVERIVQAGEARQRAASLGSGQG